MNGHKQAGSRTGSGTMTALGTGRTQQQKSAYISLDVFLKTSLKKLGMIPLDIPWLFPELILLRHRGSLAPGKNWGVIHKNSHQLNDTVVTWIHFVVVEIGSNCITCLFSGHIRMVLGEVPGRRVLGSKGG